MTAALLPLLAGFIAGILSAWGVGGGTLLLVAMTLLLGVDEATARAVNLLYYLPTAAAGLLCHGRTGLLDRETVVRTVPWGLLAAAACAALASFLDVAMLRRPFGALLLALGVMTLAQKDEAA